MFLGHYGAGFSGRGAATLPSLGTFFLAAQWADLLWPTLVLLGIEEVRIDSTTPRFPLDFVHYPYSHSLVALVIWGVLFGITYKRIRGSTRGAIVVGALVVSHWFIDLLVHRPDLPLTFGGTAKYGLGLWASIPATLALEFGIFAVGLFLYLRSTSSRDRMGVWALWSLVVFLVVILLANTFGPPPPNAQIVAWSAQALWLIVLWGYWIERHSPLRGEGGRA